jgi:hypothetical protein
MKLNVAVTSTFAAPVQRAVSPQPSAAERIPSFSSQSSLQDGLKLYSRAEENARELNGRFDCMTTTTLGFVSVAIFDCSKWVIEKARVVYRDPSLSLGISTI